MDYNTHGNNEMSMYQIAFGNFLKEQPTLRLIHLKSLQRTINKLFNIGSTNPTATMENLFFACQTSSNEVNIVDVLSKIIQEIQDIELLLWSKKTYGND